MNATSRRALQGPVTSHGLNTTQTYPHQLPNVWEVAYVGTDFVQFVLYSLVLCRQLQDPVQRDRSKILSVKRQMLRPTQGGS